MLYPSTTRDLLIRIAPAGLVQAKWTDTILDEVFTNLVKNKPDLDPARLDRTRELMAAAIRDVLVVGYEPLMGCWRGSRLRHARHSSRADEGYVVAIVLVN